MKKFILYVGLNDKDTKTQKIGLIDAYKTIENIIIPKTNGYTISEALGYYRHEDGTITTEKSLRVEMLFVDRPLVIDVCKTLKMAFNQESIAVEEVNTKSELI